MTDQERIERARRAQLALDEFLNDAFDTVSDEYAARLEAIIAREPWALEKVKALVSARLIVKEARAQITALVLDGAEAAAKVDRAKKMESMSATDRRFLKI